MTALTYPSMRPAALKKINPELSTKMKPKISMVPRRLDTLFPRNTPDRPGAPLGTNFVGQDRNTLAASLRFDL